MYSLTFYHPRAIGPDTLGLAAISSPNLFALKAIAGCLRCMGYAPRLWRKGALVA
jgi:hypothetical protein